MSREITFQKVLQTETVQQASTLGERHYTADGRRWIFVKANEALTLAHVATRIANTTVTNITSTSNNGRSQTVFIAKTGAGWTVGQFQNAYGLVDDGTGEGQFFKVKDNTATVLELFEDYRITTALDTTSDLRVARPHLAEKVAITVLNQVIIGGAQVAFAANDYGWLLERGHGTVLMGDTAIANEQVTTGDDTAGECIAVTNSETVDDVSLVGRVIAANTTADKAALIEFNVW